MWILIVSLIVLAVVAAVAGVIRNRRLRRQVESGELEAMPEPVQVDSECCGQHEVCEKESLLAAVSKKIEYYDDEELDQYIGTPGDSYTAEQEEEFRDVFYTMQAEDVAGWVRSHAGRRRSRMGTQPAAPRDCSAGQPEGRGLSRCRRTESQSA